MLYYYHLWLIWIGSVVSLEMYQHNTDIPIYTCMTVYTNTHKHIIWYIKRQWNNCVHYSEPLPFNNNIALYYVTPTFIYLTSTFSILVIIISNINKINCRLQIHTHTRTHPCNKQQALLWGSMEVPAVQVAMIGLTNRNIIDNSHCPKAAVV